jgi:hypothetical protein
MRKLWTEIIASLALLAVTMSPTTAESSTAHIACTHDVSATIGRHHKCLGAGEYCATRYEFQYERYGFVQTAEARPK